MHGAERRESNIVPQGSKLGALFAIDRANGTSTPYLIVFVLPCHLEEFSVRFKVCQLFLDVNPWLLLLNLQSKLDILPV